jgi:hypothetical protein
VSNGNKIKVPVPKGVQTGKLPVKVPAGLPKSGTMDGKFAKGPNIKK